MKDITTRNHKSKSTRKLMSDSCWLNGKAGKDHPRSTKITAINVETKKQRTFESQTEASKKLKIAQPLIAGVLGKVNDSTHGYKFMYIVEHKPMERRKKLE